MAAGILPSSALTLPPDNSVSGAWTLPVLHPADDCDQFSLPSFYHGFCFSLHFTWSLRIFIKVSFTLHLLLTTSFLKPHGSLIMTFPAHDSP